MERIRKTIEAMSLIFEKKKIRVTVSIGIAQRKKRQKSPDQILAQADAALYSAKEKGRNRIVAG